MKAVILTLGTISSKVRGKRLKRKLKYYFSEIFLEEFKTISSISLSGRSDICYSMTYSNDEPLVLIVDEKVIDESFVSGELLKLMMNSGIAFILYSKRWIDGKKEFNGKTFRTLHVNVFEDFLTVETNYEGQRIFDQRFYKENFYLEKLLCEII